MRPERLEIAHQAAITARTKYSFEESDLSYTYSLYSEETYASLLIGSVRGTRTSIFLGSYRSPSHRPSSGVFYTTPFECWEDLPLIKRQQLIVLGILRTPLLIDLEEMLSTLDGRVIEEATTFVLSMAKDMTHLIQTGVLEKEDLWL